MIHAQECGTETWWTETGAEEWADAIVAAMKLGGIDHLFLVSCEPEEKTFPTSFPLQLPAG